jgi:hypothetical protein
MNTFIDEYDLKIDAEKEIEMHILTIEENIQKFKGLEIFSRNFKGPKTKELMMEALKQVFVGLWYGDFYSNQDHSVFGQIQPLSRHRYRGMYAPGGLLLRIEVSRDLIHDTTAMKAMK